MTQRLEEILGLSGEEARQSPDFTKAIFQVLEEGQENTELERSMRINTQPVTLAEMQWLVKILEAAHI